MRTLLLLLLAVSMGLATEGPADAIQIVPLQDLRFIEIQSVNSTTPNTATPSVAFQDWDECISLPGAGDTCQTSSFDDPVLTGWGWDLDEGGADTHGTSHFEAVFRIDATDPEDVYQWVDYRFEADTSIGGEFSARLYLAGFEELGAYFEIDSSTSSQSFLETGQIASGLDYRLIVQSQHFTLMEGVYNEWEFTFSVPEPGAPGLVLLALLAVAGLRTSPR